MGQPNGRAAGKSRGGAVNRDRENMNAQEQTDWYEARFGRWESGMNGESKTPLHSLRKAAIGSFARTGFPSTREEEWRFTNVAPIARVPFVPAVSAEIPRLERRDVERFLFAGLTSHHLVFVNGRFLPEYSSLGELPDGVRIESLESALRRDQGEVLRHLARYAPPDQGAFPALNAAFIQDGAYLYLPDGAQIEEAVHLLFIAAGDADPLLLTPRNLIITGAGCRLSIVETYHAVRSSSYLTNVVSELLVGEGTVIEHDKVQAEHPHAYHVGTTQIVQHKASTVVSNSIAVGGSIVRNTVATLLAEEGSHCTLNGLSVATGNQLIDNHTTIDHATSNCTSFEMYKSILDGASRGVFNGKIFVRKDAQKTDAKQTNKTLLLSDDATIDTKPQLEIFADDVKCTHGATVGQLDDEQVFYLRSRGIDEVDARDLLTFAFAGDVVSKVHVEPLRDRLDVLLHERLRQGRVTGIE